MYFLIYTEDSKINGHKRAEFIDEHRAWLKGHHDKLTLHIAGPWTDDLGVSKGSILLIETESEAHARSWMAQDPFVRENLPAKQMLKPFNWVVGAPK